MIGVVGFFEAREGTSLDRGRDDFGHFRVVDGGQAEALEVLPEIGKAIVVVVDREIEMDDLSASDRKVAEGRANADASRVFELFAAFVREDGPDREQTRGQAELLGDDQRGVIIVYGEAILDLDGGSGSLGTKDHDQAIRRLTNGQVEELELQDPATRGQEDVTRHALPDAVDVDREAAGAVDARGAEVQIGSGQRQQEQPTHDTHDDRDHGSRASGSGGRLAHSELPFNADDRGDLGASGLRDDGGMDGGIDDGVDVVELARAGASPRAR